MENALPDALVERGNGGAILCLSCVHVSLSQRFAQGAQAGADAAAIGAVHFGSGFSLTDALERRYVICHGFSSISSPEIEGMPSCFQVNSCGWKAIRAASLAIV